VEATLDKLKSGLPGISIDHEIFRPATFIETSIANLSRALVIGAFLVIVVVMVFLFDLRVALVSLAAIPLSLVAAGIILYARDATINTMVLAGFIVALGSIVDDAIIDVENIVRRLRQARNSGSTQSTAAIILAASLEIRSPIVYATLIIMLAVVPVFFMGGLSGAFFEPLALTYCLALFSSMIVALTVTPAFCLLVLKENIGKTPPFVPWLQRHYSGALSRIVHMRLLPFSASGAMLLLGIAMLPLIGHSFLPSFKERDFLMHWLTPPGTSHPEMQRVTVLASRDLRSIPGVRNFGAHIGRALVADEVVGIDFTENWISVDAKADYDLTLARVQQTVDSYPGIYRDVQTYLRERVKEVLTGAGESIVIRVFGPDMNVLLREAVRVRDALQGIEGLVDLHEELLKEVPQVQITVALDKAKQVGLSPGEIRRAAALVFAGIEVSDIHREGKVYDVMVWSTPESRRSLTSVRELLLDLPNGKQVQLGEIADVRIASVPNTIKRENASRRIDVHANVRDRSLGAVVKDVEQRLASLSMPLGYHAELLGEAAERKRAQSRLLVWSLAAAVGVFLLLQTAFESWRLAAIALIALPAALVGGIFAIYLGDRMVSLGSLVGFLTVLGVAARSGILLIHHYQHLERHEGEQFGLELVLRGARERLPPILMTTLATGLALVPLVVSGTIPGQEIEHPMAIVILGGLVTSTVLNLFVVPSLYLRFAKTARPSLYHTGQSA
jgi:Cu/Ag efflux pump CusA